MNSTRPHSCHSRAREARPENPGVEEGTCGPGSSGLRCAPPEDDSLGERRLDCFTASELTLPTKAGRLESYRLSEPSPFPARADAAFNRVAFAAAHVVADPLAEHDPWLTPAIDWDATI